MSPTVHILILAAGASSRMRGEDKLLQTIGDKPLLRHIAEVALGTGWPVTVALPAGSPGREAALLGLPLRSLHIPDAALGMSRSLVRGVQAHDTARSSDGLMVLPADMPGFTTDALNQLIRAFQTEPARIIRGGNEAGEAGHPAIFPHDLWPELAEVTGDEGGRSVLRKHQGRVRVIPLPGPMAFLDLDTPEDWAAWRAGRP